jgi:hypothetical protein
MKKGEKLTQEHKENIRKGMIGKNIWMKGRKLSEETKKKVSDALKGKKHRPWTKEEKIQIGLAQIVKNIKIGD